MTLAKDANGNPIVTRTLIDGCCTGKGLIATYDLLSTTQPLHPLMVSLNDWVRNRTISYASCIVTR